MMEDEENLEIGGQAIGGGDIQPVAEAGALPQPLPPAPQQAFPSHDRAPIFDQENLFNNQENLPAENQENVRPIAPVGSEVAGGLKSVPTILVNPAQSKTRLKVNIKRWNGVAIWRWCANDDTCGICRFPFHGCCPDCKYAGDDCPLVWGECTHCFHIHCIMKWLGTSQTQHLCPMCRREWKFKE